MPKVTFAMDDLEVEAQKGEKLIDVARNSGSSIPFGCTNGICGTCIVKVNSGSLSEPAAREKQTLEMFGAEDGSHRLACQCFVTDDVELDNP